MEVDEIQRQVRKFQRIGSNGSANSDNRIGNRVNQFAGDDAGDGVARLCGWPSSRIVRVSRASGGKDRHSKVLTSKGLRDRRVRLSVTTAIQFYDLQDRLGYDQPSKAVEWLIKAAATSIAELPSLDASFSGADEKKSTGNNGEFEDLSYQNNQQNQQNQQNQNVSRSSACSSTSETSKGSGLSLSRSENRIRARERAREMAAKKEKEKESVVNQVNGISQNSSFTDLLTGGISSAAVSPNSAPATSPDSRIHWTTTTTPMDYFFGRPQIPQFNIAGAGQHHLSFLQDNFAPTTAGGGAGGGGESYNLNFSIASSSPGFNRGTLQSNLSSILPHHNHLQRFQTSSMVDGSTSTNFPFFGAPTAGSAPPEHFPATGYDSQRLQLYGGGRNSDHQKEKTKN